MSATQSATHAKPEVFSGPLGEQLHRRLDGCAAARELRGSSSSPSPVGLDGGDAERLRSGGDCGR